MIPTEEQKMISEQCGFWDFVIRNTKCRINSINFNEQEAGVSNEKSGVYECTNRKCKWQGTHEQKSSKEYGGRTVSICPKCGNEEFYSLIKNK